MDWTYYTWDPATGYLMDDDGNVDIFGTDGKAVRFASATEAESYLEQNDIRGNVR